MESRGASGSFGSQSDLPLVAIKERRQIEFGSEQIYVEYFGIATFARHQSSLSYPPHFGWGAAVELFRAEKIAVVEDQSNKTCRCGEKLTLVRVMVNSLTGDIVHMFECPCGERVWND
jgi:GTP cyclohydrolase II